MTNIKKDFRRIILITILITALGAGLFGIFSLVYAAEYYVDFTNGADSNQGTIQQPLKYHPWMGEFTGNVILKPGDMVYMKRGEVWQSANPSNNKGFVLSKSSGEEGALITTTAYGAGPKPKIKITSSATDKSVINVYGNNYLKFDNLDLQHAINSYSVSWDKAGIRIQDDGHHIYITNNEISYVSFGVASTPNAYHLYVGDLNAAQTATKNNYSNYIHDFANAGVVIHGRFLSPSETDAYVYYNFIEKGGFALNCHENDIYGIATSALPSSRNWPKNVFVRYNRVENIPAWTGIDTHGASNYYAEYNYVYNTAFGMTGGGKDKHGFPMEDAGTGHFIRNNVIENPADQKCLKTGWLKPLSNNGMIYDSEISGNQIFFTQRPAFSINNGMLEIKLARNTIVKNNLIYNGPITGFDAGIKIAPYYGIGDGPLTIEGNEVRDMQIGITAEALALKDGGKLKIINNLIHDNSIGVDFNRGRENPAQNTPFEENINYNIDIFHNLIISHGKPISWRGYTYGIKSGATLDCKNNIIGFISPKNEKYIYSSGNNYGELIMDNNLYYNSTSATPFDLPGFSEKNWSAFQSVGFETNGIGPNADPKFIGVNDFHLQLGSPAVDAGAALATVANDYDGILRPQGLAHDIGVYEFSESAYKPHDVNQDGFVNSTDIQFCINVILETEPGLAIIDRAKAVTDPLDTCDVLDLQAIVNEILK